MSITLKRLAVPLLFGWLLLIASWSPPAAPGNDAQGLVRMADEVAKDVESLRGWTFREPVAKKVYSEAELREYLRQRLAVEYPAQELRRTQAFLTLIGALPDTVDLDSTLTAVLMSQVGGFYDPQTKAFAMIDRQGLDFPPFVEKVMIAHELTHALDDQRVSLDSLMNAGPRTQDGEFVTEALVEGSATALMTRYVARAQAAGEVKMDDLRKLMDSESEQNKVFFDSPLYFQTLLANYSCGMAFLLKGDLSALLGGGGASSVGDNFLHAVHDRPESGEQILHPEKYWDPAKRDDPVVVEDAGVDSVVEGAGFRVIDRDEAGELLVGVVTTDPDRAMNPMAAALPAYWTNTASSGWGGDRFYLLAPAGGDSTAAPAGVWVTLWDTPRDREEFEAVYGPVASKLGAASAALGKTGRLYVFGLDADRARALSLGLASAPLRFTRGGTPWTP